MADKPTITVLGSTQKYDASTLNANFNALKDAFALVLGLGGDSESDNQITGDVDFNGNTIKNAILLDPAIIGTINGVNFRNEWVTSTAYATNDLVTESGNVYITLIAHTSGTFATDLSADKWVLFAAKGDTGAGSGDMLASNDLSDLDSFATARTNLSVQEDVITTKGDLVQGDTAAGDAERLAIGSTDQVLTVAAGKAAWVTGGAGLPRGYHDGGILANGDGAGTGDLTNDITIFEGAWRNSANDGDLIFSDIGKKLDATWATGGTPSTPTGGLSSSLTLANDTEYHVHLILVSGTVEVGFDTSLVAANLISDHAATKFRRIGSIFRLTATNRRFTQKNDEILWDDPSLDVSVTNQGTTTVTRTLPVATGITVWVRLNIRAQGSSGSHIYLRSPDQNDEAASQTIGPLANVGTNSTNGEAHGLILRTNTAGQITSSSIGASTVLKIVTLGYADSRGKDD